MNMPIPVVGTTVGPTWANQNNNCFNIVDAYDHSTGNGAPITPSGININATLPLNGNALSTILSAGFSSQSSALTGTNFISVVNGNMYFNDGSSNQIPITSGGGVAGSPGSIGSLSAPASATYSSGSKLFSWRADSGKAAAMDNGAVTIRETNVASAKGITLASPTSLASDYSLTLLTGLPGSLQYLNCDASGNLGTATADTISTSITNSAATTMVNRATTTFGVSSAVPTGNVSNASATNLTNASVTITASGTKVIMIQLIPTGSLAYLQVAGGTGGLNLLLLLDGVFQRGQTFQAASGTNVPISVCFFDTGLPSGSHTYSLQYQTTSSAAFSSSGMSLLVTEI